MSLNDPYEEPDPLAPARGCLYGLLFSLLIVCAVAAVVIVLVLTFHDDY